MLLSPAAASFDQFLDYAARGRAFKDGVAALAAARAASDEEVTMGPADRARPPAVARWRRPPRAGMRGGVRSAASARDAVRDAGRRARRGRADRRARRASCATGPTP